jgi:universal stress protein E
MPETVLISADVIESARKEQLAKLLKLSAGHHVDRDRIHLVDGAAVEALPAFVERERIDLLAMGAVSRGGFFDLFIGGTAETVLERLACDVVIIKPARLAGPMWRGERMDDTGNSA